MFQAWPEDVGVYGEACDNDNINTELLPEGRSWYAVGHEQPLRTVDASRGTPRVEFRRTLFGYGASELVVLAFATAGPVGISGRSANGRYPGSPMGAWAKLPESCARADESG